MFDVDYADRNQVDTPITELPNGGDATKPIIVGQWLSPYSQPTAPTATSWTAQYTIVLARLQSAKVGQLQAVASTHNIAFTDTADLTSKIPEIAEQEVEFQGYRKLAIAP